MEAAELKALFELKVGQIWEKDGLHYHVPRVERDHGPNRWQVIRCCQDSVGWVWVHPREPGDEPVWSLADFQEARLVASLPL